MALYVLSDPHLSLKSDKPMDVFGTRWNDWANKIKSNWLKLVKDTDTVIIPGDISWAMSLSEAEDDLLFLASLPGRKIFMRGNHDYFWTSLKKMKEFFVFRGYDNVDFLQNNAILCEDKIICGSRGWFYDDSCAPKDSDFEKISEREALRFGMSLDAAKKLQKENPECELIAFFHFPVVFGDFVCEKTLKALKDNGIKKVYYGHIHGNYRVPASINYDGIDFIITSADYLNFVPMLIR